MGSGVSSAPLFEALLAQVGRAFCFSTTHKLESSSTLSFFNSRRALTSAFLSMFRMDLGSQMHPAAISTWLNANDWVRCLAVQAKGKGLLGEIRR